MAKIISLPFQYKGKEYYTLIDVRPRQESAELKITIMNGELEKILYGNNIFEYRDGELRPRSEPPGDQAATLQLTVMAMLKNYLEMHSVDDRLS